MKKANTEASKLEFLLFIVYFLVIFGALHFVREREYQILMDTFSVVIPTIVLYSAVKFFYVEDADKKRMEQDAKRAQITMMESSINIPIDPIDNNTNKRLPSKVSIPCKVMNGRLRNLKVRSTVRFNENMMTEMTDHYKESSLYPKFLRYNNLDMMSHPNPFHLLYDDGKDFSVIIGQLNGEGTDAKGELTSGDTLHCDIINHMNCYLSSYMKWKTQTNGIDFCKTLQENIFSQLAKIELNMSQKPYLELVVSYDDIELKENMIQRWRVDFQFVQYEQDSGFLFSVIPSINDVIKTC